jgi:hypothetical protein
MSPMKSNPRRAYDNANENYSGKPYGAAAVARMLAR